VEKNAAKTIKINLSFDSWKEGNVAPATVEVPIETPVENSPTDNAILNPQK
jgi:hypothetical protein